jgi:vesicle-fusing ATPase
MMRVVSTPLQELALTNCAYCSPLDMSRYRRPKYEDAMALVNGILVLTLQPYEGLAPGSLALNAYQRRNVKVSVGDTISVESFDPLSVSRIIVVSVELDTLTKNKKSSEQVS